VQNAHRVRVAHSLMHMQLRIGGSERHNHSVVEHGIPIKTNFILLK